jgi:hypothetical protein
MKKARMHFWYKLAGFTKFVEESQTTENEPYLFD